ncbi:MAG: hypothetical protein EBZ75_14490, partial [Oxalobacteraceae bacterium]|nr:hypothetical protein [Oxalobacteraceae bacterium]
TECGYSGALTTCNKLYTDADGCSGRSNQHRFGGFPLRLPEASIGAVSGQGGAPTYQLIRDDSAFQLQRAILEFDNTFSVTDDPTNNKTVISVTGGGGGGSGTVTSVALTAPSFLTVTGSPVTTSGTLALALATQNANTVFAGPTTGSAAAPTFRALGLTDLPQIATNRLLGRVTASTGPVEEITPGTGVLTFIQTPSSSSFANAIADGTGSGVAVFDTSPTLTTPRIADIRSSTNRSFLTFVQNGSSVNYFQIGNSVAVSPSSLGGPIIETVGTSTNINFGIKSKGAGNVDISAGGQVNVQNLSATLPGVIKIQNGTLGGAELAIGSIILAASLSGSGYYTLPLSDGTSGQALSTNGSGALSWASYQPLDADLTAIAALTANGLLRKTAGVWAMDSAVYLTANQTITLSGDVTGTGATAITATIANNAVTTAKIGDDQVTYAKIQNVSAASRLLGRGSAGGSGDVEEIAPGTGLSMSGTTLNNTGVTSVALSAPSFLTV